jgi:hypothetical protein
LIADFAHETKTDQSWNDQTLKERLYGYRYTGQAPQPGWAALAEQWCVADASGRLTQYARQPAGSELTAPEWKNYPRYRGVLKGADDNHNAAALPFGVDALSRTVKWAKKYRDNEGFSVNRGTTCCAFVMACIQTAFVNAAVLPGAEGNANLTKMNNAFRDQIRGVRGHVKGEPHADGALRQTSNRGLSAVAQTAATQKNLTTDAALVQSLWKSFHSKNWVLLEWADVGLPAAVTYDCKYMYSRTFYQVLSHDNAWAAK